MNNLEIYENEEFGAVRTVTIDGEPWLCLADVCKALEITHVTDVKSRLKSDGVGTSEVIDSLGRKQNATFINEANLYKVIFQSRKPSAEKFTDWVTTEVLPAIRKTGTYNLPGTYKEALQQLLLQVEENERLALENSEMKPKAEYFDDLVDRKLLTNFRDTAKELGVKPKKFLDFLEDKKYIYRDAQGTIKPYSEKNDGLFELKEYKGRYSSHAGQQTLITPRGREVFRLLLK